MQRVGFYTIVFLLILTGCKQGNRRFDVDVSEVSVHDITIHRYDVDLFKVNLNQLQQGLESIKPKYLFFLDTDLSDRTKLGEMKDYLESRRNQGFYAAVKTRFNEISPLEKDLTLAFRHYCYYFPAYKIPRVYAYISGGDYDYPVQYADSVLLIGLDNYLGKDFKPYLTDGLPVYRISRMTPDFVIPECMKVLCRVTYPEQIPQGTLLEEMIAAGKRLLFLDAMIPQTDDRLKIGFQKVQYDWILKNEEHVWEAIIGNRMLYSTDGKLIRSFMADGPFMAEFSKDAPARIGEWIGWQIVRKYYENNLNISLQDVMTEKDAQKILSLSGYKPEKK